MIGHLQIAGGDIMNHKLDRRVFLQSASALPLLTLGSQAFSLQDNLSLAPRKKAPAVVRGAFFYPPAEVVLKGEFEDGWAKEKWSTWPGNQFEPEAQQQKFMTKLGEITSGLDIDLQMDEKAIYTNAGIEAFQNEVTSKQPDALLLFNFWNTISSKLFPLLDAFDGPIILYHPVGANHQLPPQHFMTAPKVQYIHSIENWDALERGLKCVHAFSRMSKSRLLRIAGRTESENNYTDPLFGTAVREIPASEFNDLFDQVDVSPAMKRMAQSVRDNASHVHDLDEKAFADAVRSHAAVIEMINTHDADAITIECLFLKHRKPCLSFAVNNGDLIPCGCENDYNASFSLMLGSNLFGIGGFQHNPEFDTEENLYFASHCTCTPKLHGANKQSKPYSLRPFFHQMPNTLALDVIWTPKETVTLFKYNSKDQQVNAWQGEVIESPQSPPTGGCATRVLVKMKDVEDVCSIYPGPHPILYSGNFVRQAKTFADLYGLEVRTNA